ncbi:nucleotide sugar dehydrogenase [Pseudomonadota bacterium]|nr:nucleotide sugar dehydrogenase [Pseudomonadota bacterium]
MFIIENSKTTISVIGLGYVGLPLALEFAKKFTVIGFDIDSKRIEELRSGFDSTNEAEESELIQSQLRFSSDPSEIDSSNIYIVTVPTPIDSNKLPNLQPLISASQTVGRALVKNDIVIFESTVFPGATEEICVPELENYSNLTFNKDFFVGYSPERINPGDKSHRLKDIVKVTSGSNAKTAHTIDTLYGSIIEAGTHMAPSIKVAEAAKVIENTQRDLNIALINELSIIFNKLNINTDDVLDAAGTKWNFLPFRPGLVGGHCIGVDPYYLTYKSQSLGYEPEVILAGRRLNDNMSGYISDQVIDYFLKNNINADQSTVLIMGLTFKENCPDLRNSKVFDLFLSLQESVKKVDVYDPWVNKKSIQKEYGVDLLEKPPKNYYDCIIIAVAHEIFLKYGLSTIKEFGKDQHAIFDLKSLFPKDQVELRL